MFEIKSTSEIYPLIFTGESSRIDSLLSKEDRANDTSLPPMLATGVAWGTVPLLIKEVDDCYRKLSIFIAGDSSFSNSYSCQGESRSSSTISSSFTGELNFYSISSTVSQKFRFGFSVRFKVRAGGSVLVSSIVFSAVVGVAAGTDSSLSTFVSSTLVLLTTAPFYIFYAPLSVSSSSSLGSSNAGGPNKPYTVLLITLSMDSSFELSGD